MNVRLNLQRCAPQGWWRALCVAWLAASLLAGCADYRAYQKCGYRGCAGDATITAEVQTLFKEHPALGPPNLLYVRTVDGTVYLSGKVATGLQREIAESIARQVPEARRIVNLIALPYEGR